MEEDNTPNRGAIHTRGVKALPSHCCADAIQKRSSSSGGCELQAPGGEANKSSRRGSLVDRDEEGGISFWNILPVVSRLQPLN